MQLLGSTDDTRFFGNGHEILDLREAHDFTLPRSSRSGKALALPIRYWTNTPFIRYAIAMAIEILSASDIEKMRLAGRSAARTLQHIAAKVVPGVSTAQIDEWVREHTKIEGGTPAQLGYHGFPGSVCTSRNDVVCHGIPDKKTVLADGDIVNVDVTTNLGGFHGDCSMTILVGNPSLDARRLTEIAKACRDAGIAVVREGARLGDIGAAVEELAKKHGCSVVRDFGGHGIGRKMHLDPHVPHVGQKGSGLRLRAGMAITVEPMVNLGRAEVRILDDGWTVVTADGSLSAQFEHTILVTKDGHEILTV